MSILNFPKNVQSIIVSVKIKGPKNIRFARMILDTGATYTMICPEILIEAGYDLSQPKRKLPITTASTSSIKFFIVRKGTSARNNLIFIIYHLW